MDFENQLSREFNQTRTFTPETLRKAKRLGFSDQHLSLLTHQTEHDIRSLRKEMGVLPSYKIVDHLCR